jgi:hypothetical protein
MHQIKSSQNSQRVIRKSRVNRIIDLAITTKPANDELRGPDELSEGELSNPYIALTRIENAFRSLKSDLGLPLVYHQLARRTGVHLFIAVLSYHLLAAI